MLCPAGLIGPLFVDINERSVAGLICMLFIAGLNTLIYYAFGALLARLLVRQQPEIRINKLRPT
jgi:hypothetical protein